MPKDPSSRTPPGDGPQRRKSRGGARKGTGGRKGPRGAGPGGRGRGDRKPTVREEFNARLAVDPARDAVCRFVVHQVGKWPNLDLADLRLPPGVDARDAALAHAIYNAVAARWVTLESIIRRHTDKPWEQLEKQVRAALLVGAAQLLFLDRVPAYAVLNHAVQWTKVFSSGGAGRFVNAVLRRVSELVPHQDPSAPGPWTGAIDDLPLNDGRVLKLRGPVLPDDPREALRIATGHSPGIWQAWAALDEQAIWQRAMHSLVAPPVVMNTASASKKTLERFDLLQPHATPGHHVFVGPMAQIASLMPEDKGLWVQDAASSQAVRLLVQHHGQGAKLVVDLCAGQGTKTRQLRALLPKAEILATDTDERRLITLAETFAGDEQVKVMPIDKVMRLAHAKAQVVLLDVPCSNSGVLARRPEAKYRFSEATIAELVKLQREILTNGAKLLAPEKGSALVYSTCSLEQAENRDQAAWASGELGLKQAWLHELLPAGLPGEAQVKYHDGSFAVGLVK